MDSEFDFRLWSHRASDWAADYLEGLEKLPVRPKVVPGSIAAQIGDAAPESGEDMEDIFADFQRIIPAGMTHWQHPRFFAYFQSNAAPVAAGEGCHSMHWLANAVANCSATRKVFSDPPRCGSMRRDAPIPRSTKPCGYPGWARTIL